MDAWSGLTSGLKSRHKTGETNKAKKKRWMSSKFEEVYLKFVFLRTVNHEMWLPPVAEQEITLHGFFYVLVGRQALKSQIYSEHKLFLGSGTQTAAGHQVAAADSENKPLLSLAVD